jgi:hypothetical protein
VASRPSLSEGPCVMESCEMKSVVGRVYVDRAAGRGDFVRLRWFTAHQRHAAAIVEVGFSLEIETGNAA